MLFLSYIIVNELFSTKKDAKLENNIQYEYLLKYLQTQPER